MKHLYFHLKRGILFLVLMSLVLMANAQDITVSGKISDADEGEYLPGVTIIEKGTSNGTVTDIDGNFTIKVPQGNILVFSFIGYAKQEIVADKVQINVQLSPEAMMLEETVVIGYGTQRKKERGNWLHRQSLRKRAY